MNFFVCLFQLFGWYGWVRLGFPEVSLCLFQSRPELQSGRLVEDFIRPTRSADLFLLFRTNRKIEIPAGDGLVTMIEQITPEEVAFYDALAENGSATDLMGNAELRLIASELVKAVREKSGMDWWHFDQRRKKVRTTIRRILRKYGYPPDLEDAAIRTVVLQAEALAAEVR